MTVRELKQALEAFPAPPVGDNMAMIRYCRLQERLEFEREHSPEATAESFSFRQTLVRIGPVVLAPLPMEPFAEIGLRLRSYGSFPYILALGNTNGYYSYLPSQDQICRQGYEIERFDWGTPLRFADDADTQLINENLRLMKPL